ncbi:hypothetical protein VitviT2T_003491 [Vitis vinifera]|uniref:Alpha/beta hydrolase fold-3 domain-containing protein n=2 Tax=Vitis vinifera TaxID=29760 RepID=A0ABY9BN89_VITVI|nr:probable carboxylesterase 2 [Vitis vinifera]WJZ83846.1 hypothetical protein VitviT2T_003491 [Vitis vinifera]|eukprot:XP_002285067.1 PREDICTED: probable carboxylesterase 2 [Vitis vinifera]
MDSSDNSELTFNFPPFLRVFKDGRVERFLGNDTVPPSLNVENGVHSKDIVIEPETGISARLYIPKITYPSQKLPLLIYFHGGGFCIETSSSPTYHNYLDSLVAEGNVVAVSVNYRRAPEDPLPVAYDDCWTAFKWVVSHSNSQGLEPWLNDHADFNHLFLAGDDAGANLAHNMAIRAGTRVNELGGVKVSGIILVHPYFWGKDPIGSEMNDLQKKARVDTLWHFVCPTTSGCDDPLINPATDPQLRSLGCQKVLIFLAEKDMLRDRGWFYYETLGKSGWDGVVDLTEAEAEDHVFHIFKPTCEKAVAMRKRMALFLNPQNFN